MNEHYLKRLILIVFSVALVTSWPITAFCKDSIREVKRERKTQEYLSQFFPAGIKDGYPKIYQAVTSVVRGLPNDVFDEIIQKRYPVVFTINITSGIARFANSSQITIPSDDRKTFRDGFYLIKLSDELENVSDVRAIEGIVYHELAHRYLNHLRQHTFSCEMEREANRLVKKWGFEQEYSKAKEAFGSKHEGDSPCRDQQASKDNPT